MPGPTLSQLFALGRSFLGVATIASGGLQLATGDFVRLVPQLPAWVPAQSPLAYLMGVVLIVLGLAILSGRGAREAASVLGALILVMVLLLCVPAMIVSPGVDRPWLRGFMWTNPLKALALVGGASILVGRSPDEPRRLTLLTRAIGRLEPAGAFLLAAFLVVCGLQHFVYSDFVATLVPSWIPGRRFWTYFGGVALIAGGVGSLVRPFARLAASLSALMIFLWVFLVHIPRALAGPNHANETAGVFEALALSGVALLVAATPDIGSLTSQEASMGKVVAAFLVAVSAAGGVYGQQASSGTDGCKALARMALPAAQVDSAETVAAGGFTPPANLPPWMVGDLSFYRTLPAFCRVVVKATPSADSDIQIETWLPLAGWNGKFRGQGNGGFAGQINFQGMAEAVRQGYATAGTNTGHSGEGTDASWALGHPEKVTDFGYRGIHTMTQSAKAAVKAFYGKNPERSYFGACSNGGRQALMEAQRYPEDYDGILAGAPANSWTHLLTKAVADAQATTLDPASYISSGKLPALALAVNAACDARDGVRDGVVNDPRLCPFDPSTLLCKGPDSETCLTAPQVTAVKKLYAGPRDSRGRLIFPGYLPGAEEGGGGWGTWITGPAPGKSLLFAFGVGYFANMVYERADWDYRGASLEEALKTAEEKTAPKLDATDPNLTAFNARGGKLVLYHGWNDPAISALNTIGYYDSVVSTLGKQETDGFVRLYMAPGMQHCGDGPGPNSFGQSGSAPSTEPRRNVFTALERWVEQGEAPSSIVATKYANDDPTKEVLATRPLCPYPQVARYKGQGDSRTAEAFVCAP